MLIDYRDHMTCTRCGQCKHFVRSWLRSCPSGTKFQGEPYYASGRAWLAEAVVNDAVKIDRSAVNYIYSCAMCRACTEMCPIDYKNYAMEVVQALRQEWVEKGLVPSAVKDCFKNTVSSGNPWNLDQEKRGDWAADIGVKPYKSSDEYLFYVGDVGSYDDRSKRNARAVAQLFLKGGISFGILGKNEQSDGHELKQLGERGLFEQFAKKNSTQFNALNVKKVVTLSPHSYNTFKNDYPNYGFKGELFHHSQNLLSLIESRKLDVSKGFNARVTYHDPCYLGRWNKEYDAPRKVLTSIPGVQLIEMPRNKETSFCCGGGGGNFYSDFLGGANGASSMRVKEAYETGAEVIAVACPICTRMLFDAIKTADLEDKVRLMDISEIVLAACA